jgi:hypothetical protein
MIISEGQIRMDPVKVTGIAEWPQPQNKREVQSFLGFANFYRRFVQSYAKVAHPLHSLTGNDPFVWTNDHTEAFERLKTLLTSAPIPGIPNLHDPF